MDEAPAGAHPPGSVVNLSPDKEAVLRQVHRLLKTGGEFYFSDFYADRRVPSELRHDPVL